ncbi:MAG: hypothetical protein V4525_15985 [Pseudomonadota bacterium]
MNPISPVFLNHACDILAATSNGLSGNEIIKLTSVYAVQNNVDLPHSRYPFEAPNKRTALLENIIKFTPAVQFQIIKSICEYPSLLQKNPQGISDLKLKLITRFSHLDQETTKDNATPKLIEETKHWLAFYPETLRLYENALQKHAYGLFNRNVLDDMRLALEKLIQEIVGNQKSLENQQAHIGAFIKTQGGSPELTNMLLKLFEYYGKYQNSYVKHNDAVHEEEIIFLIEITSSFMKHLIRLSAAEKS